MTTEAVPNFRPTTAPRPVSFRVDLRWQGPPLDVTALHLAQCILDSFTMTYGQTERLVAMNDDFTATFTIPAVQLGQLLQCLGVLRAHRIRFVSFEADDGIDDVTERLEATTSWSFYPDPERAARAQEAAAEAVAAVKKAARARFTRGG